MGRHGPEAPAAVHVGTVVPLDGREVVGRPVNTCGEVRPPSAIEFDRVSSHNMKRVNCR